MLRKCVGAAAVVTMLLGAAVSAGAQTPTNNSVFFTFNQPVTLPNLTLQPGRYLFQLADSLADRSIVQIFSDDRSKLYGTLMTIPTERKGQAMPQDASVTLMETPANMPTAIRSWWYPGQLAGWEFIYPKAQATTLAKTAKEPVLTTASNATTTDQMRTAPLERISSTGQETPVQETANNRAAESQQASNSTNAAPMTNTTGASAANTSAQTPTAQAPSTTSTSSASGSRATNARTRTALPKTASNLPIAGLAGLIALAAGLGLSVRRRMA